MPWAEIEGRYAELFNERIGAPAISARVAVASLIIKEKLGLSDEGTVEQIRENPYLQYFLGWEAYTDEAPFDPSMMVHFRKRANESILVEINELIVDSRSGGHRRDEPEDDRIPMIGEIHHGMTATAVEKPVVPVVAAVMQACC